MNVHNWSVARGPSPPPPPPPWHEIQNLKIWCMNINQNQKLCFSDDYSCFYGYKSSSIRFWVIFSIWEAQQTSLKSSEIPKIVDFWNYVQRARWKPQHVTHLWFFKCQIDLASNFRKNSRMIWWGSWGGATYPRFISQYQNLTLRLPRRAWI